MHETPPSPPAAHPPTAAPQPSPSLWQRYRLLLGVALGVWMLDQGTKALVRATLPFGQTWAPWPAPWHGWVRIVHWRNSGAAFGIYQGANDMLAWLAVAVVVVVVWHFRQAALDARCLRWGLALQVGGALGNLWDRLYRGSVTDFIAVGQFPVFNLADVAITFGVLCLLIATLLDDTRPEHPTQPRDATAALDEPEHDHA